MRNNTNSPSGCRRNGPWPTLSARNIPPLYEQKGIHQKIDDKMDVKTSFIRSLHPFYIFS